MELLSSRRHCTGWLSLLQQPLLGSRNRGCCRYLVVKPGKGDCWLWPRFPNGLPVASSLQPELELSVARSGAQAEAELSLAGVMLVADQQGRSGGCLLELDCRLGHLVQCAGGSYGEAGAG